MRYLLTLLISILASTTLFADGVLKKTSPSKKQIIVFTPTSKNNTYWPLVHSILYKCAHDLDIRLTIHEFSVEDRLSKVTQGVEILEKEKPDGAIFSVAAGQSRPLLTCSERLGIYSIIHGPVKDSELALLGKKPRAKYKKWIGYVYQDEEEKGYVLGKYLIEAAIKQKLGGVDNKLYLVGIGGDTTWFGTTLRNNGLKRAVGEYPEATLFQIISTKWTPEESTYKTSILLKRYPETSIIWSASDQLALGASKAVKDAGKTPGKEILLGGLDLSQAGLESTKEGRLTATVASTSFSYAQMLVLLYDYLHNIDFAKELGTSIQTQIHIADKTSAAYYLHLYKERDKRNYRNWSKRYNRNLKKYNFAVSTL